MEAWAFGGLGVCALKVLSLYTNGCDVIYGKGGRAFVIEGALSRQ